MDMTQMQTRTPWPVMTLAQALAAASPDQRSGPYTTASQTQRQQSDSTSK
jgi:hypothetical protein